MQTNQIWHPSKSSSLTRDDQMDLYRPKKMKDLFIICINFSPLIKSINQKVEKQGVK